MRGNMVSQLPPSSFHVYVWAGSLAHIQKRIESREGNVLYVHPQRHVCGGGDGIAEVWAHNGHEGESNLAALYGTDEARSSHTAALPSHPPHTVMIEPRWLAT